MINAARLDLAADRWNPLVFTIAVRGIDLSAAAQSGGAFHAQVRQQPDAPDPVLLDLPQTTIVANSGVRFLSVDNTGPVPVSYLRVQATGDAIAALPEPAELGDDLKLAWDLSVTLPGRTRARWAYGAFLVRAGVGQLGETAIVDDPAPYAADAILNVDAAGATVTLAFADVALEAAQRAEAARDDAQTARDQSESAMKTSIVIAGMGTAPSCVPWTPDQSDLFAWWDPSDLSCSLVVGGYVDKLVDKSGGGQLLSAPSAGQRVKLDTTNFGRAVLSYDGSGDVLATQPTSLTQPMTIFSVIFQNPDGAEYQTVVDLGTTVLLRSAQGSNSYLSAGTPLYGLAPPNQRFFIYSASVAGGVGRLGGNGAAPAVGPVGAGALANGAILLGNSPSGDAPLSGGIAEAIIAPTELLFTDDLHERIVGYLAWKWGVHEALPASHAYRYAPPVVGAQPAPALFLNRGPAIIPHGPAGSWYETNLFDPRILVDPTDPTKLMMYITGQAAPVGSGTASIGLWRATLANPYAWTFDRVVLQSGATGQWDGQTGDQNGVRLGSISFHNGQFWMYYSSQPSGQVGLATSPDGLTFARHPANPILTPAGQGRVDGVDVSNPFVLADEGRFAMVYTYRTATELLPGYRMATSDDGVAWTKVGDGDIITRPHKGLQMESMQLLKRGGLYHLVFEMGGNPSDGTPYRDYLASAEQLTGPYVIRKALVVETGAASPTTDRYHCATPFLFAAPDGRDILFWQGAGDHAEPYATNHWDLFAAQVAMVTA